VLTPSRAAEIKKDYDYMFAIFPRLKEREKQIAGTLSGGEQTDAGHLPER